MHDPRLLTLFAQMRWHVRPERFAVVGIDPREQMVALQVLSRLTSPFLQFTVEPGILTLILPTHDWREVRPAFPRARVQQPYRVISFDLDLPADLVGFLAALTEALAEAEAPVLAVCGYARDHLLVREDDLDRATAAIRALIDNAT
jgi:hypothetical protein